MDPSEGPVSRLRWYPDRGFELDLSASLDGISLMLVAVPLPADGTVELREGPLELDKLEILFKAQVDVQGAPGQLTEATVTLSGAGADETLTLEATVEDAESGESHAIQVEAPVQVPADAPDAGGPKPDPADEAELDWEDDDTIEAMFKDPLTQEDPLPAAPRVERDDDDRPDTETRKKQERGFGRLLQALLADDTDDSLPPPAADEPDDVGPGKEVPDLGDDDVDRSIDNLLRLVAGDDDPPTTAPEGPADPADARGLLGFLVEREQLELEPGHSVDELVAGAAPILASPKAPDARARALSEWLFEQDAVGELYIDDDSLAGLISQW